jgi:hypothetical protein
MRVIYDDSAHSIIGWDTIKGVPERRALERVVRAGLDLATFLPRYIGELQGELTCHNEKLSF